MFGISRCDVSIAPSSDAYSCLGQAEQAVRTQGDSTRGKREKASEPTKNSQSVRKDEGVRTPMPRAQSRRPRRSALRTVRRLAQPMIELKAESYRTPGPAVEPARVSGNLRLD